MSTETHHSICHFVQSYIANKLACSIDEIDINAHISSLGVDSIELLTITGELAQWLDIELPAEVFWDVETISKTATLILNKTQEQHTKGNHVEHDPALFTIRAEGEALPLFVIHDLTGESVEYMDLLNAIDKQYPVYGVHFSGDDNDTIETLANKNIQAILSLQTQGPYKLLGYCFGGVLAFETAKQLAAMGHTIDMLAIIDVKPPNTPLAASFKTNQNLLKIIVNSLKALPSWLKRERTNGFTSVKVRLRKTPEHNTDSDLKLPVHLESIKQGMPKDYQHIAGKLLEKLNRYTPTGYNGNILLLSSNLSAFCKADPQWRWQQLSHAKVESHLLPGSHLEIMHPPYVDNTARKVNKYLKNSR